jgi:DNA primase
MIVASDDMEIRLRESLLLAVVIRYPRFISEFLNDLEALELKLLDNQNILTAILLSFPLSEDQNLELMLSEKLGANKISNLFDLKYLKIAPALQSNSSDEKIRQTIIAELTKIKARQGVEREVQEALEDLQGDPDEGITWRVSKAAEANNAANRIQQDETSDELENQKILSNNLQSLIDNQVWKKKKTN